MRHGPGHGWAIQESSLDRSKPSWHTPFFFVLLLLAAERMPEVMPVVTQPSWSHEALALGQKPD